MSNDLSGRVAIVTGASTGIGLACAQRLARDGATVVMVARNDERLADAVQGVIGAGGRAHALTGDVVDHGTLDRLVELTEGLGGVDIVVNNAGVALEKELSATTDDDWDEVLRTNLTAPVRVLRATEAQLRASDGGRVVNISSAFAMAGVSRWSVYSAAKGGVISFSRSLAIEWAPAGICVNVVCPGHTETAMTSDRLARPEVRDWLERRIPMGRVGQPADTAGLVRYLCGADVSWITGQVIAADGGWSVA